MNEASTLEAELGRARDLSVSELADAIESIGFECTRCGACCKSGHDEETGEDEPHTATVFPDEVRRLRDTAAESGPSGGTPDATAGTAPDAAYDWRDVARPMPYGLVEGDDGPEGETFEWALQTDACGDCVFYEGAEPAKGDDTMGDGDDAMGAGACSVHADRPLICRTYPFSVALGGTSQPMGEAVDEEGVVRAHECEGLGREISRADAEDLAAALKTRAVRELTEAIGVRDNYEPVDASDHGGVVVYDSEGPKRADGTPVDETRTDGTE
ncbi:YkgJ family cysteine cluster protein [Halobellus sp. GM3]|uniref:YkgJ family cysteine cluster protein n=1 Tax=Halobellus sp. GM3 TaxID=3458410 RepID=UPI00403E29F6